MLAASLVPILATVLGTALGLGARRWMAVFEPVRSFALAAVCVTIALHLMPEAVEAAGVWALAVFAAGLLLPTALGWIGDLLRGRRDADGDHAALAEEVTYLGVLAHQVGDGLALGAALSSEAGVRWALFLAIGAHTIPLAAVVAITFAERRGVRAALARAALVAVTPIAGLLLVRWTAGAEAAAPWLGAAVSGLLLHVLAHDLPSAASRSPTVRTGEVLAIAAGVALPVIAVADHGHAEHALGGEVVQVLGELALAAAPALLVGIVGGALVYVAAGRARLGWLPTARGPIAAVRGALLGVPLPPCSCDVVPVAGELRARGGGPATVTAFALAAPELGLAAVLVTVALLGWELAVIRLAGAVALAVIAGVVVERIARARAAAADPHAPAPELAEAPRSTLGAIDDRVAHDGAWIVVGLVVAAFVAAAVPADALGGALDLVIAAAIALPLTVSATAATPIAAALVATGLSPGAALAGVLVGSMLNLSVLRFVRATWGRAAAAALAVAAGALAIGLGAAADTLGVAARPLGWSTGPVPIVALAVLLAMAAASLWRHGLAHWLAALRGPEHGHEHAHAHGAVGACDHHRAGAAADRHHDHAHDHDG